MMDGALALAILPKTWSKIKGSNHKTETRKLSEKRFWKHRGQRRHCQQVMTFHATPHLQLSVPSHLRLSKAAFVKWGVRKQKPNIYPMFFGGEGSMN